MGRRNQVGSDVIHPSSVKEAKRRPLLDPDLEAKLSLVVMQTRLRLLIVIIIAAAVAALPLAGGLADIPSATSEAVSPMAEHEDCCDHGDHCEKKNADGCGSTIGCMVKCSAMDTPVLATSILGPTHNGDKANLVIQRPAFVADNPPSPPPRA